MITIAKNYKDLRIFPNPICALFQYRQECLRKKELRIYSGLRVMHVCICLRSSRDLLLWLCAPPHHFHAALDFFTVVDSILFIGCNAPRHFYNKTVGTRLTKGAAGERASYFVCRKVRTEYTHYYIVLCV
jgi:hypothetical protein